MILASVLQQPKSFHKAPTVPAHPEPVHHVAKDLNNQNNPTIMSMLYDKKIKAIDHMPNVLETPTLPAPKLEKQDKMNMSAQIVSTDPSKPILFQLKHIFN